MYQTSSINSKTIFIDIDARGFGVLGDAHSLAGIIDEKGWGEVLKEGLQSYSNKVGK